jgi:hypothetical protein
MNWATLREGKAKAFIMKDLETLLRPYRTPSAKPRK